MALNDAVAEENNDYVAYLTGRIAQIILLPEPLLSEDFDEDLPDDWNDINLAALPSKSDSTTDQP